MLTNADPHAELRRHYRAATRDPADWILDGPRTRPAMVVGGHIADLIRRGDCALAARVLARFRDLCGEAFVRRVVIAAGAKFPARPGMAKASPASPKKAA